jgi:hypothetical protein
MSSVTMPVNVLSANVEEQVARSGYGDVGNPADFWKLV